MDISVPDLRVPRNYCHFINHHFFYYHHYTQMNFCFFFVLLQYGEIDCWQMECPPVTCSNPITEDGDCCPRCEGDPCARDMSQNETSLAITNEPLPCSYAGVLHDSGSSWQDLHDKCTTCECKVRKKPA